MKKILIILITLSILGCNKELTTTTTHFDKTIEYRLDEDLRNKIGHYAHDFFGNGADAVIHFQYSKHNLVSIGALLNLQGKYASKREGIFSLGKDLKFESTYNSIYGPDFAPKGAELNCYEGCNSWIQELEDVKNYFNKSIEVGLELDRETIFKEVVKVYEPTNFIAINATNSEQFDGHLRVNKKNLTLKWNEAPENQNGILMTLRASGIISGDVYGTPYEGITRFILLEDDGQEVLPLSLLEGIPSGAFVDFQMWRGDVRELTTSDGGLVNINCVAMDFLPLIIE